MTQRHKFALEIQILLLSNMHHMLSWTTLIAVRREKNIYMVSILCIKYLFVFFFFIYGGIVFLPNVTLGGISNCTESDKYTIKYVSS